MTRLAAGILSGTAFWILTHLWCHRRYLAMEAGDLEELGGGQPSEGLAAALAAGVGLVTVSPRVARLARDRGIMAEEVAMEALSGAYRRRYDRTLAAEVPWLPVYWVASLIGAHVSPASSVLLCSLASAAQCDVRFRVIPTALAVGMVPLCFTAVPDPALIGNRAVAALAVFPALAMACALAKRRSLSFGLGDVFLLACPCIALAGSEGLAVFLGALVVVLASRLAWGGRSGCPADIPLAAYVVAPAAISFIFV